jgi:hypothetical protein
MEEEHNEKWLLSKGWTKHKGFKVNHDELSEGNYTFFECIKDFASECIYYGNPKNDEEGYDDLDDAIERQEEYDEDDLLELK